MAFEVATLARFERAMAGLPPPPLAGLLRPLDAVRGRLFGRWGRIAQSIALPRARGAPLVGAALLVVALGVVCTQPLWVVALGPLVLGVPHVVADVRYLVARQGLHRSGAAWVAFAVGAVGQGFGLGVRAGLAASAVALVASRGALVSRVIGLLVVLALLALAHTSPWAADVVFVQAHNLIGVGLWLALRPRALSWDVLFVAVLAVGGLVLFIAPLEPWLAWTGGLDARWTGLTVRALGETLSPSNDAGTTLRFVLFFAFAQTAHYVVWLGLVPQRARHRRSLRSLGQSWRALQKDVGPAVLWAALLAALGVGAVALASVALAREVYLGIAFFHTHLELVAAAFLFAGAPRALETPGAGR